MTDYERNADVSKTLTEQWKKGEIPEDFYYVKSNWTNEIEIKYVHDGVYNWKEIVRKVPTYDEWQSMDRLEKIMLQERARLNKQVTELFEENTKLKKDYKDLEYKFRSYKDFKETAYDLDTSRLEEENTKLKELLKECQGSIATMLSKRITEVNGIKQKELLDQINQALGEDK